MSRLSKTLALLAFVLGAGFSSVAEATNLGSLVYIKVDKWSPDDKRGFINHYNFCTDESRVTPVSVKQQFPLSKCQDGGTCAVYAGAAVASAALDRSDPQNFKNRAWVRVKENGKYRMKLVGAGKGDILEDSAVLRRSIGGGSSRVNKVWKDYELFVHTRGCHVIKDLKISDKLVHGDYGEEVLTSMLCGATQCTLGYGTEPKTELMTDAVEKSLLKLCEEKNQIGEKLELSDVRRVLIEYRKKVELGIITRGRQEKANQLLESFYKHKIDVSGGCDGNNAKKTSREILKRARAYLCAGIPLQAGIALKKGDELSSDGGKSYIAAKSGGNHAMVLAGFSTQNEKEYAIFRDSQAYGTLENPDASIRRIPVDQLCRLTNLDAVVTPDDRSRIDFIKENKKLKKIKQDFPSYDETAPGEEMLKEHRINTHKRK